jgi:hypothetical protein
MNWKQLQDEIERGAGQNHLDDYMAWIRIKRRNPSSKGNQVSGDLPGYQRLAHFLARVEWHLALLCLWLGALDVREQFPLWPMPHPHPLAGFPGRPRPGRLPEQRGLLAIAREAGIDHGWQVGHPDIPYVATVDLAVTLAVDDRLHLAMIAGKPRSEIERANEDNRVIERLNLQRLYAEEADANFAIADSIFLGEYFGSNLEHFAGAAFPEGRLSEPTLIRDFAAIVSERGQVDSINNAIRQAGGQCNLTGADAAILFRTGVWRRLIDIDISQYIVMCYPLVPGAMLAEQMKRELFKEAAN